MVDVGCMFVDDGCTTVGCVTAENQGIAFPLALGWTVGSVGRGLSTRVNVLSRQSSIALSKSPGTRALVHFRILGKKAPLATLQRWMGWILAHWIPIPVPVRGTGNQGMSRKLVVRRAYLSIWCLDWKVQGVGIRSFRAVYSFPFAL